MLNKANSASKHLAIISVFTSFRRELKVIDPFLCKVNPVFVSVGFCSRDTLIWFRSTFSQTEIIELFNRKRRRIEFRGCLKQTVLPLQRPSILIRHCYIGDVSCIVLFSKQLRLVKHHSVVVLIYVESHCSSHTITTLFGFIQTGETRKIHLIFLRGCDEQINRS